MVKQLWPHQEKGKSEVWQSIDAGNKTTCLASPTGAGKSEVMRRMLVDALCRGWDSVLYTNRKLLMEQTAIGLQEAGIDFGYMASGYEQDPYKQIQLSSMPTIESRVYRSNRWDLHKARLVLIDEAHQQKAASAVKIIGDHIKLGGSVVGFTATPIDIGHIYTTLIQAGLNSELRECGAHVIAKTYAPDEPDLQHIRKYKVGEDLSDADNAKVIMRPGVFGRVFKSWKELNPEARPTILFGPDVAGSIYFAEQFARAGIPAAHIDGRKIWENGNEYNSGPDERADLFKRFKEGRISVICNRFVLREGIDLPFAYHGIFATVFGSLQSYLQAGGRLLRAYPGLDHVCLSRDTLILTNRGEIPIQDVKNTDLVWDGVEFVQCDGSTCNGNTEVIEWDGLRATPTHKVHTENGWETIETAKACGRRITQSGIGGSKVRVHDYSDPHDSRKWIKASSKCGLRKVWIKDNGNVPQNNEEKSKGMQAVYSSFWGSLPRMDLQKVPAPMEKVQRQKGCYVQTVRWPRNTIQILFSVGCCLLDCVKSWCSERQENAIGQDKKQWKLRAWKSKVGNAKREYEKQKQIFNGKLKDKKILKRVSKCKILTRLYSKLVSFWFKRKADKRKVSEIQEVWDIVNAGPRHRFTANGKLVANCIQDHGGNWHRHGSLNSDRYWSLDDTSESVAAQRQERLRNEETDEPSKEAEPIKCLGCGLVRASGPVCPQCGKRLGRGRQVVQIDGTLKTVEGKIYKPRAITQKPEAGQIWERVYYRARNSNMTFRQAEALFMLENGYKYPPRNLPLMPTSELDWYRKVKDVPREKLREKP